MHDSFAFNPPKGALPPLQVRFSELHVEQWPDGQRVRVHISIKPFQQRPDLEATIFDENGKEIANTLIIETLDNRLVFTMHLPANVAGQEFTMKATLSYRDIGTVDEEKVSFTTHSSNPTPN